MLIDSDSLLTKFESGALLFQPDVRKIIEAEATVDAVPVVRCKDCERYVSGNLSSNTERTGGSVMKDSIERQDVLSLIRMAMPEETSGSLLYQSVKQLPTIDAVPVVRCKDCGWWDRIDDGPYGYCHACKHGFYSTNWEISIYRRYKEDFFCADGERRTDATN